MRCHAQRNLLQDTCRREAGDPARRAYLVNRGRRLAPGTADTRSAARRPIALAQSLPIALRDRKGVLAGLALGRFSFRNRAIACGALRVNAGREVHAAGPERELLRTRARRRPKRLGIHVALVFRCTSRPTLSWSVDLRHGSRAGGKCRKGELGLLGNDEPRSTGDPSVTEGSNRRLIESLFKRSCVG